MPGFDFEEFIKLFQDLEPKAQNKVLNVAVFLVWTQTGKATRCIDVVSGFVLWANWKARAKFQRAVNFFLH